MDDSPIKKIDEAVFEVKEKNKEKRKAFTTRYTHFFHFCYSPLQSSSFIKASCMDPLLAEAISRGNPVVFFDISIAGVTAGRIKIELFKDVSLG